MARQADPAFPTQMRKRLTRGRLAGVDGSLWLYRSVPMAPVIDARDSRSLIAANYPIREVIDELAATVVARTARRTINKSSYRQVHILLADIPRSFNPPSDHPRADALRAEYADTPVRRRVLLFGVRLTDRLGGDTGLAGAVASVAETLWGSGTPVADFDPDVEVVDAICSRAGMRVPTDDEIRVGNAWHNYGWVPEVVDLEHLDHLHVFASADSARAASALGEDDCDRFGRIPDHSSFAFGAVEDFNLPFFAVEEDDPAAAWCASLVSLGATAVSIRGLCEPAGITRGELRRHRKKFVDDINERASSARGNLSRSEQEEMLGDLTGMESLYASGGPATLVDTSVLVAFAGVGDRGYDLGEVGASAGVRIAPMVRRQRAAFAEMMLCSPVSSNPHFHDLPSHMVAASGMTSLSTVGDRGHGAVLGFTEHDRQPAWISPVAAANEDQVPLFLVAGQSGSGKLLDTSTIIPTPAGKTRMGDISVGDRVFGRDGRPCTVLFVSDIDEQPDLYAVSFDDGQVIHADCDHQWVVSGHPRKAVTGAVGAIARLAERCSGRPLDAAGIHRIGSSILGPRAWPFTCGAEVSASLEFVGTTPADSSDGIDPGVAFKALAVRAAQRAEHKGLDNGETILSTGEMLAAWDHSDGFRIRLAAPISMPDARLGLHPYVLGVWLGSGRPSGSVLPGLSAEMADQIAAAGMHVTRCRSAGPGSCKVVGLAEKLSAVGATTSVGIPAAYLRASAAQRITLLRGVSDAAGHVDPDGRVELTGLGADVAVDVAALARSLGAKAWRPAPRVVRFALDYPAFADRHRVAAQPMPLPEADRSLQITSIVSVAPTPARCITVDSPDSTYLAAGFVPTHNTVTMLHLATQFAAIPTAKGEKTPCVILDPKQGSDHSPTVLASGGQVASLDEITAGDGIYDPIRFASSTASGVELASSLLLQINPWGSKAADFETPLVRSLAYGIEHGATCTGEALGIAGKDRIAPAEMVERVFALSASPLFRACVGMKPGTAGLRVAEGITYVRVGGAYLDLPAPGATSSTQTQRISAALVRMMVYGSAMALTGRQGVVMLDEAWVFLGSGRAEVERLGRLARSQQVLPMLFTQRVTDALDAGLTGAISRGVILSFQDESEARSALKLFNLEPTPGRLGRMLARDTIGGVDGSSTAPNWSSYRALRDWETKKVLRGSIGIYADLYGRAVPVEIVIPPKLFTLASTNPDDIRRRQAAETAVGGA